MGFQLNIKDAIAVGLARRLAVETGMSVTAAVRSALEEKVARIEAEHARRMPDAAEVVALFEGLRGRWKPEFDGIELSTRHGDLLYDEAGLPE